MSGSAVRLDRDLSRKHRTIRAASRISLAAPLDIAEVWQFRDLLVSLAVRDVKLRYRQTALGVVWVLLQPLIAAGIFTFVFAHIANLKAPGDVPYFVFAMAGQIAWMAFSTTLTKTSTSLVINTGLVSKIFFPRLVLPLSTLLTTLVDFAIGLVILLILIAVEHVRMTPALLLLPVWFLLIAMLSLGVGLFTGALMVRYRDIGFILPVALQFLLYASPVPYALAEVGRRLGPEKQAIYLLVNPLAPLLEAFRWSLFAQSGVPWGFVAYATGVTLALLYVGAVVFRREERKFADVI